MQRRVSSWLLTKQMTIDTAVDIEKGTQHKQIFSRIVKKRVKFQLIRPKSSYGPIDIGKLCLW